MIPTDSLATKKQMFTALQSNTASLFTQWLAHCIWSRCEKTRLINCAASHEAEDGVQSLLSTQSSLSRAVLSLNQACSGPLFFSVFAASPCLLPKLACNDLLYLSPSEACLRLPHSFYPSLKSLVSYFIL